MPHARLLSRPAFFLAVASALLVINFRYAEARSIDSIDRAAAHVKGSAFEVGKIVRHPQTPQIKSLRALIKKTAGGVSRDAVQRFGWNVREYLKASSSGRAGKAAEAIMADDFRKAARRAGSKQQLLVTAVEGFPQDPADLVLIDEHGRVRDLYQVKLGNKEAVKALRDPKYKGMKILLPPDEKAKIEQHLAKAKRNAARRGIPLSKEWREVEEALKSGRLADNIDGTPLRNRSAINKIVDLIYSLEYSKAAFTYKVLNPAYEQVRSFAGRFRLAVYPLASRFGKPLQAASWSVNRALATAGSGARMIGKAAFPLADVALFGMSFYHDWQRYRSGELGAGLLSARLVTRASEGTLLLLLWWSPEPFSKVALVGTTFVIAADWVTDWWAESSYKEQLLLMASIDHRNQYSVTRRLLLQGL